MVELGDLRDARLSPVESAGAAWRKRLGGLERDAVSDLIGPLHGSRWTGDAATAAFGHVDGVDDGFGLLAEQATAVGVLLDTAASKFAAVQRRLTAIEQDARDAGARIRPDGGVEPPFLTAAESADDVTALAAARRNNATAHALADRLGAVLAEATRLDEQYAAALTRYVHPPSGRMSAAEILDAGRDATVNASVLGADRSAIPSGSSAWSVRAWWDGLSADQQRAFRTAYPDEVGALNGVPAAARDQANRQRLARFVAAMEVNAERLYGHPGGPIFEESYEPARKLQAKLEASEYEKHRLYLLGFNPDFGREHQGRAIVAVGDPDHADNVATMVPGLNTELEDSSGHTLTRAQNLVDAAEIRGFDGKRTSVIAWLDYDAPEGYSDDLNASVITTGRAEQGAARLDAFVNGLHATHDGSAHYTVIGHSYGSTTVGYAAAHNDGLAVDDLIVAGSPGTTVDSASELHVDRHHVWVGQAADDPIDYVAGLTLGKDPTDRDFGANRFHVDTHGHGDYWEPGTESLAAQAAVVTGDYDYFRVTPGALEQP